MQYLLVEYTHNCIAEAYERSLQSAVFFKGIYAHVVLQNDICFGRELKDCMP